MLFDTSKKVLDSRFLKKDDVIKPGETIAFDSYLIDIGEHQGGCSSDSKAPGDKFTNFKGTKMDRQKTYLHTDTHETVGKRGKHTIIVILKGYIWPGIIWHIGYFSCLFIYWFFNIGCLFISFAFYISTNGYR